MSGWFETNRGVVFPWHCDQFGHMNVRWYAHIFDDAAFHIWSAAGFAVKDMAALGVHTVVARTATDFVREIRAGELFLVRSAFTRCGNKSCDHRQQLLNADTGTLHAVQNSVEVFFDPETRRSVPMPDALRQFVEANLIAPEPA